jgi:hypothetical protein
VIQLITYGYFVIYSGIHLHLNYPVDSQLLQHFQIIIYISAYAMRFRQQPVVVVICAQQCQRARIGRTVIRPLSNEVTPVVRL